MSLKTLELLASRDKSKDKKIHSVEITVPKVIDHVSIPQETIKEITEKIENTKLENKKKYNESKKLNYFTFDSFVDFWSDNTVLVNGEKIKARELKPIFSMIAYHLRDKKPMDYIALNLKFTPDTITLLELITVRGSSEYLIKPIRSINETTKEEVIKNEQKKTVKLIDKSFNWNIEKSFSFSDRLGNNFKLISNFDRYKTITIDLYINNALIGAIGKYTVNTHKLTIYKKTQYFQNHNRNIPVTKIVNRLNNGYDLMRYNDNGNYDLNDFYSDYPMIHKVYLGKVDNFSLHGHSLQHDEIALISFNTITDYEKDNNGDNVKIERVGMIEDATIYILKSYDNEAMAQFQPLDNAQLTVNKLDFSNYTNYDGKIIEQNKAIKISLNAKYITQIINKIQEKLSRREATALKFFKDKELIHIMKPPSGKNNNPNKIKMKRKLMVKLWQKSPKTITFDKLTFTCFLDPIDPEIITRIIFEEIDFRLTKQEYENIKRVNARLSHVGYSVEFIPFTKL